MYFEVYQEEQGFWRWTLVASNGRIIADSGEGYVNKASAYHGIDLVKQSFNAPVYER